MKRKFDHISDDFQDLHWLPMAERIKFSFIMLVYKVVTGQGP